MKLRPSFLLCLVALVVSLATASLPWNAAAQAGRHANHASHHEPGDAAPVPHQDKGMAAVAICAMACACCPSDRPELPSTHKELRVTLSFAETERSWHVRAESIDHPPRLV